MDLILEKKDKNRKTSTENREGCCDATVTVCLTFMRRHQQVDSLGGQTGPNLVDLPLQVSVVQALSQNPCLEESYQMCNQHHPRPQGKPM